LWNSAQGIDNLTANRLIGKASDVNLAYRALLGIQSTVSVRTVELDKAPAVAVTVRGYVPSGVPGERDPPPLPHEQHQNAAVNTSMADSPNRPVPAIPRRTASRTIRIPRKSNSVTKNAVGGVIGEVGAFGTTSPGAVVVTLTVTGTALMPSRLTMAGETEHTARFGAPPHFSVTV